MATLRWELNNDVLDQGATLTARLVLDCEGVDFGAANIDMYAPAFSFSGVDVQQPAWLQAADHFCAPDQGDVRAVDVASSQSLSGNIELCTLSCTATGARGRSHQLNATLLSAVDADGLPLTAGPIDAFIRINAGGLGVMTTALPDAEAGVAYAAALQAQGGQPPHVWSVISSTLPPQLSVSTDGLVTGTPAARATVDVTVRVTDTAGATDQGTAGVRILAPRPAILTTSLAPAIQGSPYSLTLSASGGEGTLTWEASGLPSGLAISGGQIAGTVADTREANNLYEVTLSLTDQARRSAQVTLPLVVMPGRLLEQTVSNPRLVAAAPDLLLAEYDIRINASAFMKQDDDTRAILQDAMDELIGELADLTLGDGPLGDIPAPRDPHPLPGDPTGGGHPGVVDPGPLDEPPHPGDPGAREAIEHLLQQYKDLDRMQSGAVVTAYYADVYVDDQQVCNVRKGILPNRHKGAASLSIVRARTRPNAKSRAFREARREDKRQVLDWTRQTIHAYFLGGRKPNARTATQKTIAEALQRLRDLLRGFDLRFDPPTEDDGSGRCRAVLTTGPHRLRTSWGIVSIFQEGSVLGAAEAASTQASVTVDFTPRNPNGWPRLNGSLAKTYSGARSGEAEEIVEMPQSAVDLLVQQGSSNTLRILAATGKPDQPFAAPVAFQVQPGAAIGSIVAGPADGIGRSSVVMLLPSGLRAAWNDGPSGYQRTDYPVAIQSVAAPQFGRAGAQGDYSSVMVLEETKLTEVSDFRTGNTFGATPLVRRLDLAPLALGDPATSLVRLNNSGTRWGVSFRLQGETQAYEIQGEQLVMTGALNGLDGPAARVLPVATLRGPFMPNTDMLVQAQSQARALHVSRFDAAGKALTTVGKVIFPLQIDDALTGPNGDGVVVLTEAGNLWLVWWLSIDAPPRLLPLWLNGQVAAASSAGNVVAAALPDANKVIALVTD